jgi:tetrahydromethanopterin S-methyltransferase subunit C
MLTNNCLPWDNTAAGADGQQAASAAGAQVGRQLIVVLLLTAAALDLTRCSLVLAAARHPAPAAGLVVAGLCAAALTARAARGCQVGQRWAGWAALLIGIVSAPQAAASGYRTPYTIPDTATAVLGMLLAITVLATAGQLHRRDTTPAIPVRGEGSLTVTRDCLRMARDCDVPGPAVDR